MKLILQCEDPDTVSTGAVVVRLLVLNDTFEAIGVDRRLLIGPNPVGASSGPPLLISVEPASPEDADNTVTLNPWCLYGRQRSFEGLSGQVSFHAYLLRPGDALDRLGAAGPLEPDRLLMAAGPLVIDFS
ncbi:MAG: hypothetical protein NVSMB32_03670 [Actinomycetota bacterium]